MTYSKPCIIQQQKNSWLTNLPDLLPQRFNLAVSSSQVSLGKKIRPFWIDHIPTGLQFTQKILRLWLADPLPWWSAGCWTSNKRIGAGKYGWNSKVATFHWTAFRRLQSCNTHENLTKQLAMFFSCQYSMVLTRCSQKKNMYSKASDSVVCLYLIHVRNGSRGSRYSRTPGWFYIVLDYHYHCHSDQLRMYKHNIWKVYLLLMLMMMMMMMMMIMMIMMMTIMMMEM